MNAGRRVTFTWQSHACKWIVVGRINNCIAPCNDLLHTEHSYVTGAAPQNLTSSSIAAAASNSCCQYVHATTTPSRTPQLLVMAISILTCLQNVIEMQLSYGTHKPKLTINVLSLISLHTTVVKTIQADIYASEDVIVTIRS